MAASLLHSLPHDPGPAVHVSRTGPEVGTLRIRRLGVAARAAVRRHFAGLEAEGLYRRFGHYLGEGVLDDYVTHMDFAKSLVLGACAADGSVVGLLELRPRGAEFEVGLSVLPGARGAGLGDRLLSQALRYASALGARRVVVYCLASNQPMMDLARHHGARFVRQGGDAQGIIELGRYAVSLPQPQ